MSLAGKDPLARPNPPPAMSLLTPVRLTLLNTLKNSARNSNCAPSCPTIQGMCVLLVAEKSVLIYPGPSQVFRLTLANCPRRGAGKRLAHMGGVGLQLKTPVLRN